MTHEEIQEAVCKIAEFLINEAGIETLFIAALKGDKGYGTLGGDRSKMENIGQLVATLEAAKMDLMRILANESPGCDHDHDEEPKEPKVKVLYDSRNTN